MRLLRLVDNRSGPLILRALQTIVRESTSFAMAISAPIPILNSIPKNGSHLRGDGLLAASRPRMASSQLPLASSRLIDKLGRAITDLRISVTDRCNYKCVYCRTGNEGAQYAELPIADYLRMARVFISLGIEKIRLTGGEPLLRKGLVEMISELARMRTAFAPDGTPLAAGDGRPLDIAITTNGHLLAEMARPLKDAGLSRITVSMDAVDAPTFARITRVPNGFESVLAGIRAARSAGLYPVKVNCVLLRGFNEDQIEDFARFSRSEGVIVRFIEFMPLEEDRVWSPEVVVPLEEITSRLAAFRPLVALPAHNAGETARRYTLRRWHGRDRYHRSCLPSLLRPLQPRPSHLGRQNPHLPVLAVGPRPLRCDAARWNRSGPGRVYPEDRAAQRGAPPYRRAWLFETFAQHGSHRRLTARTA